MLATKAKFESIEIILKDFLSELSSAVSTTEIRISAFDEDSGTQQLVGRGRRGGGLENLSYADFMGEFVLYFPSNMFKNLAF